MSDSKKKNFTLIPIHLRGIQAPSYWVGKGIDPNLFKKIYLHIINNHVHDTIAPFSQLLPSMKSVIDIPVL